MAAQGGVRHRATRPGVTPGAVPGIRQARRGPAQDESGPRGVPGRPFSDGLDPSAAGWLRGSPHEATTRQRSFFAEPPAVSALVAAVAEPALAVASLLGWAWALHGHISRVDLALALGERVAARGRPWRLCSGVVAHTALANPHFWIEIETVGGGWVALDPSLPLIARTFAALGVSEDWRAWVRAYCGGCDARRIILCRGEAPVRGIPGGATLGSTIGEVVVETPQGQANAWPCLDWVCGECRWEFNRT